ncbi:MAG: 1-deoxy-D-xylulose-5-phosphate synthase [Nitrospinota bacterium]
MAGLLDRIDSPEDLKRLKLPELEQLAEKLRQMIIEVTSKNGGHLGASLGAVELVIALHYLFDAPRDKLIWDVGHQAYAHKILTGRRERFPTLRQWGGIAGFPDRRESPYDHLNVAHGGTSISAALGFATARDFQGQDHKVVAIIGDGSLTSGMAMEALNNAGALKKDLIVILNDNRMSISPNVGAMSSYLARIMTGRWAERIYRFRRQAARAVAGIPGIGAQAAELMRRVEESLKNLIVPGMLFEELGFRYVGPLAGHRLDLLIPTLRNVKRMRGPVLVHVITRKGQGYPFSEGDPVTYHGVSKFEPQTGRFLKSGSGPPAYTKVFVRALSKLAREDEKVVAITAAMLEGTGLVKFQKEFPERCFDVAMCEQHAVTFAVGLALAGMRPVAAIYSTFLQRAYDQIVHDVCLTAVPVTFAIDRAGLVGDDGPTHQGAYDIAYLRTLPNMVVMAPKDENELQHMLKTALYHPGPAAVRYPRGAGVGVPLDEELRALPIGKGEVLREGEDVALLALGSMVPIALEAAEELAKGGVRATVVNLRFVKPLDEELILGVASRVRHIVTAEEHSLDGGCGSAVLELLADRGLTDLRLRRLGFPDRFIEHGSPALQREDCGLTAAHLARACREFLEGEPGEMPGVVSAGLIARHRSRR